MKKIFFLLIFAPFIIVQASYASSDETWFGAFKASNDYSDSVNIEINVCFTQVAPMGDNYAHQYLVAFQYNIKNCAGRVARLGKAESGITVILDEGIGGIPVFFELIGSLKKSNYPGNIIPIEDVANESGIPDENHDVEASPSNTSGEEPELESQNTASPKIVLKIIDASYDKVAKRYSVVSENEDVRNQLRYYQICTKDFLYTPSGAIVGCKIPNMLISEVSVNGVKKKGGIIYKDGRCGQVMMNAPIFRLKECLDSMINDGYIIEVGEKDYMAATASSFDSGYYVVSADQNLYPKEKFIACKPDGNFTISEEGFVTDCDRYGSIIPKLSLARAKNGLFKTYLGEGIFLDNLDLYFILIPQ